MAKFRLTTEHKYWWPVTIELPDPEQPGKWTKQAMTMRFVSMTSDEAQAIQNRIDALATDSEAMALQREMLRKATGDEATEIRRQLRAMEAERAKEQAQAQHDHLIAASCGWRDVVDEAGEDVDFSEEALRQALSITWYRTAIYQAWAASQVKEEARRKN